MPDWLFAESYDAVGDVAETVALLLPTPDRSSDLPLSRWVEHRLLPLRDAGEEAQKAAMLEAWGSMDRTQRFVWNKLISGELPRRGLAAARHPGAGEGQRGRGGDRRPPTDGRLGADPRLLRPAPRRPTPATPTTAAPTRSAWPTPSKARPTPSAPIEDWQAEWKWDGIRSQLIRREGDTFLWTRGEELVTDRYPELATLGAFLPDGTAIDGEILPWRDGAPLAVRAAPAADRPQDASARRSWPRSPSS